MKTPAQPRLYELDWLRTAAIILVVWYHTGMFFVSWDFHINSSNPVTSIEPLMVWMHKWRMPLLLFISGIGTAFMLRNRSIGRFVWDRHNRLFIPLLFGMFFIVPPQIYIEKIDQYASFLDFYPSVFQLEPYPEGNFSWHHLWFILYLFLYSLIGLPLFAFFRSKKSDAIKNALGSFLSRKWTFALGIIPFLVAEILLRRHFPEYTHGLTDDWAGFTHYFLYFIGGYFAMVLPGIWQAIKRDRWFYTVLAITSFILLELRYFELIPDVGVNRLNFIWVTLSITTGWFTLLALIGWAQVHLRRRSDRLSRWNEASYPVYILHQSILIVVAYPFIDSSLPWQLSFTTLFLISLVGSFLIYQTVIKHFNPLRLVFGLKWKTPISKQSVRNARPLTEKALPLAEH
ncbi:putative acyltransferase, putative [Verrucomicrobiia bacterium DG1235]|nr:putative acyltransferase, putative [Verrucomicrobiae bacterium DG1235]